MPGPAFNWEQCFLHASLTDVGMRRANNQDAHACILAPDAATWYSRGHVFMVADGMGAHAAGELASKLAVDGVPHIYHKYADRSPPEAILQAIGETNIEVNRRGVANTDFHNMGTTSSVLLLLPQGAVVAHIGDSRVYRLRGHKLEQLTFDHSLVWEMQAAGQLSQDAGARGVIPKNVITRSLGPRANVKVDLEGPFPTELGDTFLVCSDGLTGPVKDEELGAVISALPPKEAVRFLVDLANLRGGPDNITVIVVKIVGPQITTQVAGGESLTIGGDRLERSVNPILWIVTGVCFLAAIVMAILGSEFPAVLASIGGIIGLLAGILQKYGVFTSREVTLAGNRRLGRGPHRSYDCPLSAEFLAELGRMLADLRSVAASDDVPIDLARFDSLCQSATHAAQRGDLAGALRAHAQAMNLMMNELKYHRRKAADSSIDI
jgi:serine/threonine protein phosphatase PrpC